MPVVFFYPLGFWYFDDGKSEIRYLHYQVYFPIEYIPRHIAYISLVPSPLIFYYGF